MPVAVHARGVRECHGGGCRSHELHMSYVGLSQATLPVYGSLVFSLMCMQVCVES